MENNNSIFCKQTLKIISKNIKHFRTLKNMSQIELGLMSNLTPSYITNIERNPNDMLLSTICKIAQALDIPVYELFVDDRENYLSKSRIDKND